MTCVVLFGCIAMLLYPWVAAYFFAASPVHAGIFLGTAIHDTSQVIGCVADLFAAERGPAALAAASVAKLLRNLSIAILIPAAAWLSRREEAREAGSGDVATAPAARTALVPFFVVAFLGFIVVRTAGDAFFPAPASGRPWSTPATRPRTCSSPAA